MNPFVNVALSVLKGLANDQKVVDCVIVLLKELAKRSTNNIDDSLIDVVAVMIKGAIK